MAQEPQKEPLQGSCCVDSSALRFRRVLASPPGFAVAGHGKEGFSGGGLPLLQVRFLQGGNHTVPWCDSKAAWLEWQLQIC